VSHDRACAQKADTGEYTRSKPRGIGPPVPGGDHLTAATNSFSEMIIAIEATTHVRMVVRNPAGRRRPDRSNPITNPATKASPIRSRISPSVSGVIE
jgi:hypothetical protein